MDQKTLKTLAVSLAIACVGSQEGQAGDDMLEGLGMLQSGQSQSCQSSQASLEILNSLTPQEMLQRVLSNITHPFSKEGSSEHQDVNYNFTDAHLNGFSDVRVGIKTLRKFKLGAE